MPVVSAEAVWQVSLSSKESSVCVLQSNGGPSVSSTVPGPLPAPKPPTRMRSSVPAGTLNAVAVLWRPQKSSLQTMGTSAVQSPLKISIAVS